MKKQRGLVNVLAIAALAGLIGCGDDDGGTGDGDGDGDGVTLETSISGVIPGEVFAGRETQVLVIGSNTEWADGVTVDFGEGVTVGGVTVASPTALLVNVTTGPTAALGTRDVSVGDLSFTGGFELVSPIRLTSVVGSMAQGSVNLVTIQNLDFANPFDTTFTGDGFFEPIVFTNLEIGAGDGTQVIIPGNPDSVQAYSVTVELDVDVTAAGGAQDVVIVSGPPGGATQNFVFGGGIEIAERAPIELVPGTPATGTIAEPLESHLYVATPAALDIVLARATADTPDASPAVFLLGPSGSFQDVISFSDVGVSVSDEPLYIVYLDGSGATGYDFEVSGGAFAVASALTEAEPNNNRAQSGVAEGGAPIVFATAEIASQDDEDWIQFDLTAEQVGDGVNLLAVTYGPDPLTDTVVSVFRGDEPNPIAESTDFVYLDSVEAFIDEPGTYYVVVTASPPPFWDPDHIPYDVAIVIE